MAREANEVTDQVCRLASPTHVPIAFHSHSVLCGCMRLFSLHDSPCLNASTMSWCLTLHMIVQTGLHAKSLDATRRMKQMVRFLADLLALTHSLVLIFPMPAQHSHTLARGARRYTVPLG